MQVILLIGIQAVGKSTFYKERFADTHVRINRDMLKTRNREATLFQSCLDTGQSLVIDNTNATREVRERFVTPARGAGAELTAYYFHSAASQSLLRNADRHGTARVPDEAIIGMSTKLEFPTLFEGFNQIYYVRITEDRSFSVRPWTPSPLQP